MIVTIRSKRQLQLYLSPFYCTALTCCSKDKSIMETALVFWGNTKHWVALTACPFWERARNFTCVASKLIAALLMTWMMKTVLQWTNVSAYRRSYVMSTCLLSEVMCCVLLCVQFVLQVCQSVVDPHYLSGASDLERPVSSGVQTYGTQKEEWPLTKPMTKRDATYQVQLAHLFQNLFSPACFFTGQSTCLEGVLKLAVLSCFVCVCVNACAYVCMCVSW